MSVEFRQKLWDLVRPIHSPITRRLRQRLGRNYGAHPEMELPPPYEAIQLDVERHLNQYLHVSPEEISQIVIVGAHEADEVDRLRQKYPNVRVLCFEPNPNTHQRLCEKFQGNSSVTLSRFALGASPGKARFYELDMPGNGSLLEPDIKHWAKFNKWREKEASSFEVEVSTLDREAPGVGPIDLLWMDVQGGEGSVLTGAEETLKRTRSIFLEVTLFRSPYNGAMLFPEISALLQARGFTCAGLGIDSWNGSGNAFFVKEFDRLVCREA